MANSRLEKIGTIYTRTRGLIEAGALKWVDRPIWYDLYESFPPKDEPKFNRPAVKKHLRNIFYEEDKIRQTFHSNNKYVGTVNLGNSKTKTVTQQFIDVYKKLETQYAGSADHEKIYVEAMEMYKSERESRRDTDEFVKLSTLYNEAKEKNQTGINIKNILKD